MAMLLYSNIAFIYYRQITLHMDGSSGFCSLKKNVRRRFQTLQNEQIHKKIQGQVTGNKCVF